MQHILEYHYLSFTGIIDLKTAYLLNVKKNKYAHTQEKKKVIVQKPDWYLKQVFLYF